MSLQQAEDESLRDYLTRFSNESSRITSLDQGLAVFALRNDLQAGKFLDFMVMHPPQTLEEALDASDKYIGAEEWNKKKSQSQSRAGKAKGQVSEGQGPRRGKAKASKSSSAPEPKKDRTPYTRSTTKDKGRFKKPRPLPPWHQQKGKDRWCEFHESIGYRTEDCLQQKDQIKDLVQKGYLKKYLAAEKKAEKDPRQELDISRKKDKSQGKETLDILVISGGTSQNAVKRHLRGLTHQVNHADIRAPQSPVPNILFTAEDCKGLVYSHEDPLAIVTGIANHNVCQSLVDGGSGANILFRGAFD
ncbi:uncharacterized protein LOC110728483 [Chenopodium quinoa]|uniref:uncharacterized protein LOC110728483 n=1 Tax=Chenopodium quinoa TaxID=63459 RepID=UPI000B76C5B4|nr:uncharacterized protein LOC110728483 [Chenopodium quinoa]